MTTYTNVFGGDTVPPSDNRYVAVTLTADTTFYWPEQASGSDLMADIMEVTSDAAWSMTFPAANIVSTGRDVLVRNLGAYTITLKDSAGGTIGTVDAGVSKYLYVTDNSTAAGTWTIFTFGTGTSAADAATLAGYGLVATGNTLSQQYIVTSTAITTTISATTDRARTIVFTNSGTVTCDLPSAATAGNGFFVNISNQGTGTVTIDGSGSETIDGETTKALAPGESCTVVCNAVLWASIGYGRSTQFQFTKLVLDISTGSPFTLTSAQASNKLIQTIGTITGATTVNVPAVVAVYYIQCSHSGAFSTTFKTAAGTGVALSAGDHSILYCDGTNVVAAQTAAAPAANLSGGSAGVVVYQSAAGVTSFTAAGSAGEILLSGGTGVPTWSAGTGSGVPVRATSPTLVTPALGTPSSGTLTNCTGLPTAGLVNDAVTYAKMQNVSATDKLLGRSTAGSGDVEEITCTSFARSILDDANEAIFKATVNLEIGVDVQAYDAALTSLSGLSLAQGDLLYATAADTLARLAKGTASQVLRMNSGATAPEWYTPTASGITLGTLTATTSGTSIDFTSIPSGAKRITVSFHGVSGSGTSQMIALIGDSGGVETSGYVGGTGGANSGGAGHTPNWITNGIALTANTSPSASGALYGQLILVLMDAATNLWSWSLSTCGSVDNRTFYGSGTKALSATLDRIRLTTAGGSDTFDAGSMNIAYE